MQKQFNDSIIYVRNGKPLPAIVLASQATAEGELLTLLYADPVNGPQLLAQGTTRGIAQVAIGVPPVTHGAKFGWVDSPFFEDEEVVADATPKEPVPADHTGEDVSASQTEPSSSTGSPSTEASTQASTEATAAEPETSTN